jgi:hypothetical protein
MIYLTRGENAYDYTTDAVDFVVDKDELKATLCQNKYRMKKKIIHTSKRLLCCHHYLNLAYQLQLLLTCF